jgi:hypothetical protein
MKDVDALDLDKLLNESLSEQSLKSLIDLVAQTSWWVSPAVYQNIQVVYPKTRRKKGKDEKRDDIVNGIRLWDNQPANQSFWMALGKTNKEIKNYFVCHIYDGSVWTPDHFTNLANITAFPKSLQSLSEWKPIADILKYHSYKIYGYTGLTNEIPSTPKYYPELWQHIDNPNKYKTTKIIDKLKDQSTRRPMCSGR